MNTSHGRRLRVAFVDHGYGSPEPVLESLRLHYDVAVDPSAPDVIFCGDDKGTEHEKYPGALKIQLLHENRYPDFSRYHYAIGLRTLDHPRWFRQPLYVRTSRPEQLLKPSDYAARTAASKSKFCTLVATNANKIRVWRRLAMADALDRGKPLDFGGPYRNNVGGPVADKLAFYAPYRFAVAFENGGMRGHTTEKIVDAMIAGCIPVFWGNPDIAREFNPKSFVNAHEFPTMQAIVERVLHLENTPAEYERMLAEPWFHENRPNEHYEPARLGRFLRDAIDSARPKLYKVYPPYRWHDWTRKVSFVADWAAWKLGAENWG